ncbi:MAG: hypothetical protein AB4352_07850 [Hormoscilla sp.]
MKVSRRESGLLVREDSPKSISGNSQIWESVTITSGPPSAIVKG